MNPVITPHRSMTVANPLAGVNYLRPLPRWHVKDVIKGVTSLDIPELPCPPYTGLVADDGPRVMLGVESMSRHMTDEGYQLQVGLAVAGYHMQGHGYPGGTTHVPSIVVHSQPCTVFVQDKREWMGETADHSHDPKMRFKEVEVLGKVMDVFKVTVLKDAHQKPDYHMESAREIGCHCWTVYYHSQIVKHVAPYVREADLIRTYHTVDHLVVPDYHILYQGSRRHGAVVSGALSGVYPLRLQVARKAAHLPDVTVLRHPGYHRDGCRTPDYIRRLGEFRVSICTSSKYGYALRKVIESTAAGCIVVTDLPVDDRLPMIDENLVRVRPDIGMPEMAQLLSELYREYDPERQIHFARICKQWYDYRQAGWRLAAEIESRRREYPRSE